MDSHQRLISGYLETKVEEQVEMEGEAFKRGLWKHFGHDGYIHYLDLSKDFMIIYVENYKVYILNIYSLLNVTYI